MLSLDHIVFAGLDIEEASEKYGKEFALKSVKGGVHENWGTYNYLAHFSNHCYVEWLGIKDLQRAEQSENPLINHLVIVLRKGKQGPFQFALRTNKLDEFVEHFNDVNIRFIGPVQGKRKTPEGTLLTWRMLFPLYDVSKEMLPFLIEWDQPEEDRMDASLVNGPAITTVYYGGTTIERFTKIYNLSFKNRKVNKISLKNASIVFTDKDSLSINLM